MKALPYLFLYLFLLPAYASAQDCDCEQDFIWVKKIMEENDAGFQYALDQKGIDAYQLHNDHTLSRVRLVTGRGECRNVLSDWLKFFRTGHLGLIENATSGTGSSPSPQVDTSVRWETVSFELAGFKQYLSGQKAEPYEGIWETEPYTIGIKREGDGYIGFIIESGMEQWSEGKVKLKFKVADSTQGGIFYLRNFSPSYFKTVELIGNNYLRLGNYILKRKFPVSTADPNADQYYKFLR